MKTLEILKKMRALISIPQRWIKGNSAKSNTGTICFPNDPKACRFCLSGALMKVSNLKHWDSSYRILEKSILDGTNREHLYEFNDDKKVHHKDVIALLDKAIKTEELKDGK